jgi:hypothetical protein
MRSFAGTAGEPLQWHLQIPYAKHVVMSLEQCIITTRFELSLDQPDLRPKGPGALNDNQFAARARGHVTLNQAKNTVFGGRYTTHNAINKDVMRFAMASGCTAAVLSLAGILGPRPGKESDTRPDILICGLRGGAINGLIGDVVITHPIDSHGNAKGKSANTTGAAALAAEKVKDKTYVDLARKQGFDYVPMAVETCGLIAPRFIVFLRRLAAQAAGNVPTIRRNARDTPKAYAGRLFTQWIRKLSITRARSIADRLRGASAFARATVATHAAALHAASIITPPI